MKGFMKGFMKEGLYEGPPFIWGIMKGLNGVKSTISV